MHWELNTRSVVQKPPMLCDVASILVVLSEARGQKSSKFFSGRNALACSWIECSSEINWP